MKRNWLAAIIICCMSMSAGSQTLFTYGKYKADESDFLRAFNKNNPQTSAGKAKAMREYLDLYVNSRLKIREAYDRRYDTLPQIKSEVDNLRNQIIENYMSDPNAIDRLSKEAFQRSLKDIHIAHIFIADPGGDTAIIRQRLNTVMERLKKEDFMTVAQQLSDDPSAKTNKGDLSYITVFTLPYELENVAYATAVGTYSKPYRSRAGYHILKNLGERKPLGAIRIQQILLAFPPNASEADRNRVARLADSLYKRIKAGDDFAGLANTFSNDIVSAFANGSVPKIHVGQYDPEFEKAIWALPGDSAIGKPLLTPYGYHIIKRISVEPVVTNPADQANMDELKDRVTSDDRWKTARDFIYTRVKNKPGVQRLSYTDAALWAFSDSVLDYKPAGIGKNMTLQSPLFKIGDMTYKVVDWIGYVQTNRYKQDRSGIKPYDLLMDEFTKSTMYNYYRDHLEEYNADFRNQMNEFKDGNLFFEIMQQEVWNKAQADSMALVTLYGKNKEHYNWKQSAEAVIFFCSDEATAKTLAEQLKKNPADWKKIADAMNEKVVTDSGRYEWSQIPGLDKATPQKGMLTPLTINSADNTASFAYILSVYTQTAPRSFSEAKGLVMNDYQLLLEEQWVKSLKKKYPVVVNQAELAKISK